MGELCERREHSNVFLPSGTTTLPEPGKWLRHQLCTALGTSLCCCGAIAGTGLLQGLEGGRGVRHCLCSPQEDVLSPRWHRAAAKPTELNPGKPLKLLSLRPLKPPASVPPAADTTAVSQSQQAAGAASRGCSLCMSQRALRVPVPQGGAGMVPCPCSPRTETTSACPDMLSALTLFGVSTGGSPTQVCFQSGSCAE